MHRTKLSGKTGAALDPCAAIQTAFDIADDEEHEVIFRLGAGKNITVAQALIKDFEGRGTAQKDKKESSGNQNKLAIKDKIQNKKQPVSLYGFRQEKDSANSHLLKTPAYEFQSYTFLRMR